MQNSKRPDLVVVTNGSSLILQLTHIIAQKNWPDSDIDSYLINVIIYVKLRSIIKSEWFNIPNNTNYCNYVYNTIIYALSKLFHVNTLLFGVSSVFFLSSFEKFEYFI